MLAVPELEEGNWAPDANATSEIINFVSNGGALIKFGGSGDNQGFLNAVFGFNVVETSAGSSVLTSAANLSSNSATDGLRISSLPAGSQVIYQSGDLATVALIPVGDGFVIYMGWDWFNAAPVGLRDGGWLNHLIAQLLKLSSIVLPTMIASQPMM